MRRSDTIRVISNIYGLEGVRCGRYTIELSRYPKEPAGLTEILRTFFRSFRYDYILLNFVGNDLLVLALFKLLVPFNRCRLVSLDLFLARPEGIRGRLIQRIKSILLRRMHRFLVYIRDTRHYEHFYGIRADKFRYLPYKINAPELIAATEVTDQGFIFSGGKSRRDFQTLIDAITELPCQLKIVTVDNRELRLNGCYLDDSHLPGNVEVIRHDGSVGLFVKEMAASRLVVLPILKDTVMQAGIAVYVMAMALRKCVIISSGPGVEDVLTEDQAIIVPAGEPGPLAAAIKQAYEDDEYRRGYERRAYAYAQSLQGSERLRQNIVEFLGADF